MQANAGNPEVLRHLAATIDQCERILAARPPFFNPKAATYEAIAVECLKIARLAVTAGDWTQLYRLFDMIHNFGMLLEKDNAWDDAVFLNGFAKHYLKESPEAYLASLRPLFGQLMMR